MRAGQHGQVLARQHRVQVGGRRRAALAIAGFVMELGHLVQKGAGLFGAVVVVVERDAVFSAGTQKCFGDGARTLLVGHLHRAAAAAQGAGAALVVLGFLEVGQQVRKRPAGAAQAGPFVVVFGVAPHIQHGIDGRGAAQCLAARLVALAAQQARLGHGFQRPVVDLDRLARHHRHHACGQANQQIAALATGLNQAHAVRAGLGQARGQHAARRAAAHDDVVKFFWHVVSAIKLEVSFWHRHAPHAWRAAVTR